MKNLEDIIKSWGTMRTETDGDNTPDVEPEYRGEFTLGGTGYNRILSYGSTRDKCLEQTYNILKDEIWILVNQIN